MEQKRFELPATIYDAFATFVSDTSLLALPLKFTTGELQSFPAIQYPKEYNGDFQVALSRLGPIIEPKTPLYLILRRDNALSAITYIPHLAPAELKTLYLENRHELVQGLGESHFTASLICKEVAEVMDIRSWNERDLYTSGCESYPEAELKGQAIKDLGHLKNKCRLCDRRMKNELEESASDALKKFSDSGDCIQISVDMQTGILKLNFYEVNISPETIEGKLPTDHPSLTFYRHLESHLTYFIFCSPDSAPVKECMTYVMAIPGLINIIAKECGINVDQKIEIHDREELEFGERDKRIGKFRSMYLRNEFVGTESTWESMEASQKVLDSIR
ncbi:hypothetical protein K505DRAFT_374155 [Melanomma pulvis-pyrius CBS 109.77]|uniref:ADF-H domain-containing protein n=1 Tax=Melanomma pulvis-pyrius CBS 109.77 TaxID=1314802 RepID=A0A6A6XF81_9PLEO|nr:hypothetical protein K505DRAFT_374155 [Melanomma pulvis-pyrius CBS 109.77]